MKANFYTCQECPDWDDVNGCWRNSNPFNCNCLDENLEYKDKQDEKN